MSEKAKKIINIVVDVVVAIILVFVLILAISGISSKMKGYDGYTEIFGKAYVAVRTDSMAMDYNTKEVGEDNFAEGDLIAIKVLKGDARRQLKVGDIITFKFELDEATNTMALNTHRIVEIGGEEGYATHYITKGDNTPDGSEDPTVFLDDIVGVYTGKASGIGHMFLFMNSSTGFFVCVVLPSLLVVAYFAVNLVLVILKERKVAAAAKADEMAHTLEDEKEKMRQELLAEMAAKGEIPPVNDNKTEEKPEEGEQPTADNSDKKD